MKVLIIGAKGMLGQELARAFGQENLYLWDFNEIDISNSALAIPKIKDLSPDLIINSAAYNDVDGCEANFELALAVNSMGPIILAKAAEVCGAKFVHYSTDYVFHGDNQNGYSELSAPDPISRYGESKLIGEKAANYCSKCYIIRTSRLFGLPASSATAKKGFVDVMLRLADERESLDVVNEEFSNPTYVVDLADFTKMIVMSEYAFGLYHGVNAGACTWFDFAREIFKQANKNVIINPVPGSKFPRPAKRPAYSSLLNTKVPSMRTWQKALSAYLAQRKEKII